MPRALAVVWELVSSDLQPATKKATALAMDEVLGLRLREWHPAEDVIPATVMELVNAREVARKEKRWKDADQLRQKVADAGYEIEDTPQGPRVRPRPMRQ